MLSQETKLDGVCCLFTCIIRKVKGNSLERRNMIHIRNSHLHKGRKSIGEEINKGKIKTCISFYS